MTNKDELREALDGLDIIQIAFETESSVPMFDNIKGVLHAHLELLELGVTVEDIKALIELKGVVQQAQHDIGILATDVCMGMDHIAINWAKVCHEEWPDNRIKHLEKVSSIISKWGKE